VRVILAPVAGRRECDVRNSTLAAHNYPILFSGGLALVDPGLWPPTVPRLKPFAVNSWVYGALSRRNSWPSR